MELGGIPTKFYANLGYQKWSSDDDTPFEKSDQMLIGAGIKMALRKMVFMTEYTREQFVETENAAKETVIESSEQPQRMAVGVRFPLSQTISLDLGYQMNLAEDDSNTPFVGDYHDWKVIAAFKKVFYFEMDEEKRNRMILMERIRQEEAERLQSLEKERQSVEDEIDALKRLIEEGEK